MIRQTTRYGLGTTVPLDYERAVTRTKEALAAEGFGVLTEIDVAATLKAKLGVDRPALKILGACNPNLANRALQLDSSVSLLLPCNIVLEPANAGTRVAAVDPHELMHDPRFIELADDAANRLRAALDSLSVQAPTLHVTSPHPR